MFSSSRGLDSFDQYLQDVEKYPLIQDPAEERELARRARAGDKEAAERLVTANLRFVISYVKKYQGRGLNLAELVCIGNEGLLKAVKKFDPDKGVKFISYAVWWIRQTVLQALAEQTRWRRNTCSEKQRQWWSTTCSPAREITLVSKPSADSKPIKNATWPSVATICSTDGVG